MPEHPPKNKQQKVVENYQEKDSGQSTSTALSENNNPPVIEKAPVAPTHSTIPMTEAEAHYRSLTDFFKYLVSIVLLGVGILVGVGLYITNKDMSAMRAEVRQNISDIKLDLRQSLSDVKAD